MNFRTAAGVLGSQITTADLAHALGLSAHSVRQARLQEGAPGYRRPPDGWQRAFARLARERIRELESIAEVLERTNG